MFEPAWKVVTCHGRFSPFSVQVVAEEGGFDVLPELEGGFVASKGDGADGVSDGRVPILRETRARRP